MNCAELDERIEKLWAEYKEERKKKEKHDLRVQLQSLIDQSNKEFGRRWNKID